MFPAIKVKRGRRYYAVTMALLVVPRLGTNPSNVRVQYIFGLGDALSLMACRFHRTITVA